MGALRTNGGPVQGEASALLPGGQLPVEARDGDEVLFGVGTVMSAVRLTRLLPASISIRQATEEVRQAGADDPAAERALALLESELAAPRCEFFATSATGEDVPVDPETRLSDIAVPIEIRTPTGLRDIKAAQVHVQAYSRVGGCHV